MDLTIDRINDAYTQTKTHPVAGRYYRQQETGTECCVLSVLYLERFGTVAMEALLNQTSGDWSYDPVPELARSLEINIDVAKGIVDGFDGNDPFISYPESSITEPLEYEQGFQLGRTARRAFIDPDGSDE